MCGAGAPSYHPRVLRILTVQQNVPGGAAREASLEELHKLIAQQGRLVWVDLFNPTPEESAILLREFRFHPVSVEDALEDNVHPKIDDYQDYLYIVLHGVLDDTVGEAGEIAMHEVDFFLGKDFLVTHHDKPSRSIEKVWERVKRQPEFYVGGPDFMFQGVVETMVDRYLPLIEKFDERIDQMEDDVFAGRAGPEILERIFGYKRSSLQLRRTIHPQREVIRNLAAGQYRLISKEAQILLRDTYDHLFTVAELIESYRDLLSGALDAHLSVTSNRMNEVMKTLTIITTTLMPISVLSGIYGMNFDHIPFAKTPFGFLGAVAVMAGVGVGVMMWIRTKRWI